MNAAQRTMKQIVVEIELCRNKTFCSVALIRWAGNVARMGEMRKVKVKGKGKLSLCFN
jgi:hypothetical protein